MLPKKIIPIANADKAFHESWKKGRDPLNLPHPFRMVCLGPPNSGKTTIVKNLILRAKPEFDEVVVIHCDSGYTSEYEDIGEVKMMDHIPSPEDWEGEVKTLCVIDDMELKTLSKDQRRCLDRLVGYVSTHKNLSVIICLQDTFNCPPIVRRCSNVWVLWKSNDIASMASVASRSGLKAEDFKEIFDKFIKEPKDSLWIDRTDKTPYPLRINGYTMISEK